MALPPFRDRTWPLVGVVHLDPLPGSPGWEGSMRTVLDRAYRDAAAYVEGGFDGYVVENYGDRPFAPGAAPPATVAALAAVAARLRDSYPDVPQGINVLRNDGVSALAVAVASGARFVRVNVLVGAIVADQGIIEGRAWDLALHRRLLGAAGVSIWADVMVKHAVPLGQQTLAAQAADALERGGAAVLILSGRATGAEADPADFVSVRNALPAAPLAVGSGLDLRNFGRFRGVADGAIVASALYGSDGRIDPEKVRILVAARDAASGA